MSRETGVPVEWGPEKNVVWKTKLSRPANGSPIVSAGRVFVTSAEDEKGTRRSLYCLDRADGNILWVKTVSYDEPSPTHQTNPYCGSTPASDGKRVVVWHASAGLHCYDHEGHELWSRDLGRFEHMWGYGTSPILHRGRVILYTGPGRERIFVTAIDLETGKTIWETEEPMDGDGERNRDGKYMGSWATPIVLTVRGKEQYAVALPTRVVGYDAETGEIAWWCEGIRGPRGDLAYSSPLSDGEILVTTGGYQGPSLGVELGEGGDLTSTHRLWRKEQNPQSIGSGILLGDVYYKANAGPGTIQCVEARTGKELWTERGGANYWSSLVWAEGRIYATDQQGTTLVFKPSRERFEKLASNALGEPTNATPAISQGRIFMRTAQHVVCIGSPDR